MTNRFQNDCGSTWRPFVRLLPLLLFAGCVSLDPPPDPTRIFVLGGSEGVPPAALENPADSGVAVGIREIRFPPYVDDPRMATRKGPYEIVYSEVNRWGSPPQKAFSRTVYAALKKSSTVRRVQDFPWVRREELDLVVEIEMLRFDGEDSGPVVLAGSWWIRPADIADVTLSVGQYRSREARWTPGDYASLAAAMTTESKRFAAAITEDVEQVVAEYFY